MTAYGDNVLEVQCELYYISITCRQPLDNRNDLISRQLYIILGLQEELQVGENVISDKLVEHERFKVVYATFAEAQPYLQRKCFLKEDNIKTVERLCHKFGEVYPVSFRSEAISPKMHEYIFHVPKFFG